MLLVSDANSPTQSGGALVMLTWENDMEVHAVRKHGWSLLELPDPPRSWGSGVTGMAFDRLANVCKTGLAGSPHRLRVTCGVTPTLALLAEA